MIERARRGFTAPSTRTLGPGPELEAVSRGVGQIGAQARGYAAQKFDQAQRIKAEEEQEAARRIREREIADDNAAFINAEIEFNERVAELRSTLQGEVGPDGDGYAKKLKEQAEKLQGKAIEGLPSYVTEEGRQRVSLRLAQLTASERMNATQWQDARAKEYAVTTYTRSLNAAATSVIENPDNAQSVLQAQKAYIDGLAGRLSAPERDALWRQTEQQMLVASIDGLNQRGDFAQARELIEATAGVTSAEDQRTLSTRIERAESEADRERAEALALSVQLGETDARQLKELHSSGVIGDAEYGARLAQVERMEASREAERKAAFTKMQAENAARIKVAIDDDQMGRADVNMAYEQGQISTAQWSQLALQANDREQVKSDAVVFLDQVQSGVPFDPNDAAMKRGADELFKQVGGSELLSENFSRGMMEVESFAAVGIIPPGATRVLRGMLYSQDEPSRQKALSGIYELHVNHGGVTRRTFNSDEVADAISYGRRIEAGMTPEMALAQVAQEQQVRAEPTGVATVRQSEARALVRDVEFNTAVKDVPGGFLSFGGVNPKNIVGGRNAADAITQNYRDVFTSFYMTHGDEELAKEQAQETIARTIGKSEANNGRYMMHPPEIYYPGASSEDMIMQVQKDVSLAMGEVIDPERITLTSDQRTARDISNGFPPSYAMIVEREDGAMDAVPGRFVFDGDALRSKAEERSKDKANIEGRLEKALARKVRAAENNLISQATGTPGRDMFGLDYGIPTARRATDELEARAPEAASRMGEAQRNLDQQKSQRGQFRANN